MRWLEVLRMRLAGIPCFVESTGSPEGVINGQKGDRYYDTASDTIYDKTTNTGSTGWVARSAGGSTSIADRWFAHRELYSDSLDATITFTACTYDTVNDRMLIGGDNSFVGFIDKADFFNTNKIQEVATLPSTVIGGGGVSDIWLNPFDNGIVVRISNDYARAPASGSPWTAIPQGGAVSQDDSIGFSPLGNDHLISVHFNLSGGRNYSVSQDNGVTWNQPAGGTGAANRGRTVRVSPSGLTIIGGFTGGFLSWSTDTDLDDAIDAPVWNNADLNVVTAASGDPTIVIPATDSEWMIIMSSGDLVFTTNAGGAFTLVPRANNPFFRANTTTTPLGGFYSSELGGYILMDLNDGISVFYASPLTGTPLVPTAFIRSMTFDNIITGTFRNAFGYDPAGHTIMVGSAGNRALVLGPWE